MPELELFPRGFIVRHGSYAIELEKLRSIFVNKLSYLAAPIILPTLFKGNLYEDYERGLADLFTTTRG
jgi:hypothetical protein